MVSVRLAFVAVLAFKDLVHRVLSAPEKIEGGSAPATGLTAEKCRLVESGTDGRPVGEDFVVSAVNGFPTFGVELPATGETVSFGERVPDIASFIFARALCVFGFNFGFLLVFSTRGLLVHTCGLLVHTPWTPGPHLGPFRGLLVHTYCGLLVHDRGLLVHTCCNICGLLVHTLGLRNEADVLVSARV